VTIPNQLTIFRILLIPVVVGFIVYYGQSCAENAPNETWRVAAIAAFLVASASDGLDGWIARRFDQRSRLGTILDPIADKGLLLATIIGLSLSPWPEKFPLWFPLLVATRDVLSVGGALLMAHAVNLRELTPHWTGKVATATQMAAVGAVMLRLAPPVPMIAIAAAGVFTFASGMVYLATCVRALRQAETE
jgi:CDP-diacylglycerol--glycerol-3-phosphate 3-phosphatidyltransferase/cardiolipin synthase